MKNYEKMLKLVGRYFTDEQMTEKVAYHCLKIAEKDVCGYVSEKIVAKYLKSQLCMSAADISSYLDDVNSKVILMPNNGIDDLAEELESLNFTALELLASAPNYNTNDYVVWVNTARKSFGSISEDKVIELYGDDFADWAIENKYTYFFNCSSDDENALTWILNSRQLVADIINEYLTNN